MPFIFFACFVGVIFLIGHFVQQNRTTNLKRFASEFRGRITNEPSFLNSSYLIEGESEGFPFILETRVSGGKHKTHHFTFTIDHNFDCGHMKISQKGFFSGLGESLGLTSNQKIGRADIEDKYSMSGSVLDLSEFFAEKGRLRAVDYLKRFGISEITITPREIIAYGRNLGYSSKKLSPIVETLGRISASSDSVQLSVREKNVKVTGTPQKAILVNSRPNCPYCRDTIDSRREDIVRCRECNTPHHGECYDEAGGCTIYACKTKKRPNRRRRTRH